jgi:universal stress protein E
MRTPKPRTILAAISDPDERSQLVIERAAQLAAAFGAELVLLHAAFESALSGQPFFDSKRLSRSRGWLLDERTRALERHAHRLRAQGLDVRSEAIWQEPAHESIIRAAIRDGADLVVAGPHVRGRTNAPSPLRHTDWQLLRLCPQPLLLVRAGARGGGSVIAALDPFQANDKPVALDRALILAGAAFAVALDVPFFPAHSISPALYSPDDSDAVRSKKREQASVAIRRMLERAKVDAMRTYLLEGRPEDTVPLLASKLGAQLLVTGAISRRGLQRFEVGDTAERLILASPCDLLILKPRNFKLRLGKVRREPVILPEPATTRSARGSRKCE